VDDLHNRKAKSEQNPLLGEAVDRGRNGWRLIGHDRISCCGRASRDGIASRTSLRNSDRVARPLTWQDRETVTDGLPSTWEMPVVGSSTLFTDAILDSR